MRTTATPSDGGAHRRHPVTSLLKMTLYSDANTAFRPCALKSSARAPLLEPATRTEKVARCGMGDCAGDHQAAPWEQHYHRSQRGTDEPCPLVEVIPSELPPEIGRDKRAGDSQERG